MLRAAPRECTHTGVGDAAEDGAGHEAGAGRVESAPLCRNVTEQKAG
jgi:hypothetical protein